MRGESQDVKEACCSAKPCMQLFPAPNCPPQGWLAFMKDIGSTNLVPGTRTRSDNTMHVRRWGWGEPGWGPAGNTVANSSCTIA